VAALRYMFGNINYGIAFTKRVNSNNIGEIDSMSFNSIRIKIYTVCLIRFIVQKVVGKIVF